MAELSHTEKNAAGSQHRTFSRWTLGMLNDKHTEEVPGSVLLLSDVNKYNAPLGLQQMPARTSASSLPSLRASISSRLRPVKKTTSDGKIILEPQPTDSANDPLNWPVLRRDLALVSLGFYCMVGGGMTPILAAGFSDVADDLNVTIPQVALTTGLYMLGLGLGSVVLSPTAILYGKRPVYLVAAIFFVLTNVWCALSPNFASLVVARISMGFAVSSVECLPSASIAEIYFLHEKAYRLGIYTLLLLGGKNLVPLISAVIIQTLGWRWVFWIVAIIVAFAGVLLFFCVPETFWDRNPVPRTRRRSVSNHQGSVQTPASDEIVCGHIDKDQRLTDEYGHHGAANSNDETAITLEKNVSDPAEASTSRVVQQEPPEKHHSPEDSSTDVSSEQEQRDVEAAFDHVTAANPYTASLSVAPPKSTSQQLKIFSGRLSHDNWCKVAFRPFILFAYPSILWSALVYALSIGWLIVLSESVASIYENRSSYNFTALQVGLVYISPFVGGILGTAVAGKISDIIVRYMARKNGGIYEPEFRLVMAIPIAITTVIGLMGFGWSAQERDAWIVPTLFFGIISFGCSLGSTTAITFAVDSYRQYAGEALVTLNFSKNVLHGLVWSLFFNRWLEADGSKTVFVAIGGIQLACLLTTIPIYIFGKRGRMWTVRKNLMERF